MKSREVSLSKKKLYGVVSAIVIL